MMPYPPHMTGHPQAHQHQMHHHPYEVKPPTFPDFTMSMDDQERRKLERKRLRNRMAASKCRQKKLERIADLEQQVSEEKQRGIAIDNELEKMRVLFRDVQQKVLQHQQRGCQGTPAFAFKC